MYIHSLTIHVVNFHPQLLSPLPDISVVKSLQLLGWSAACGDISLAQDASIIHQYFLKVALQLMYLPGIGNGLCEQYMHGTNYIAGVMKNNQ